ncbi:MAG TPA: POTRA domain-containing protein [Bryobacteraceae bacterium]|nr:POTRA domain-containing protein [Bryobacteraceae bacterium]
MRTLLSRVFALIVLCPWSLWCAAQPPLVSRVDVVGAPARLPLETHAGEALDDTKLRHDVNTLWRSGRFSDIRVETIPDGDSVHVVFRGQSDPLFRLRKVRMDPPTPNIHPGLAPDSLVDARQAQQAAAHVRQELESSGYPDARVNPVLLPTGPGRADLTLKIDKGQSVDIDHVVLSGDLGVKPSEARHALHATRSRRILPPIPGIWHGWRLLPGYNPDGIQSDIARLRSFYYSRGYFDASVKADSVDVRKGKAAVDFHIDAGPRYSVRSFTLAGPHGTTAIKPGADETFPVKPVCRALFAERRDAERTGVLDFSAQIVIRDAPGGDSTPRVDADATTQWGKAYRIRRIEFRGNRRFHDLTLRRLLLVDEGQPLDQTLLRKTLARFNQTGLFEPLTERDVVVNTPPDSNQADVTIWLKERKLRSWSLSGPVGPMSIAGPLEFALGTRLPAWGQGALELSTYAVSLNFMLFAKPMGALIPFLPNKRFIPLLEIQRPLLPGQRWLSGFTIAPQFGWQGLLASYGMSQARGLLGGVLDTGREYLLPLSVEVLHNGTQGTMSCDPPKPRLYALRRAGGIASGLLFSFSPF